MKSYCASLRCSSGFAVCVAKYMRGVLKFQYTR